MNKKNILYMIAGIIIGVVIISILIVPMLLKSINKEASSTDKNINNEQKETITENDETNNKDEIESTKTPEVTTESKKEPTITPQIKEEIVEEVKVTEEVLINTLSNEANNITKSSLKDNVKNSFITIVDFIFYDKEIKGHTFNSLTLTAKLKVIKIALTIDNKIDSYFPDYKDYIKDKYTKIKSELIILYLKTTTKVCETLPENSCTQARNDFKTMKESFNFTFDLIKSFLSNKVELLEEWYLSIK
ncbi:MAG: hypothetical protein PHQ64_02315 [Bacilli bacterium]|nr:hypothetical protein [Bacilli bacterium]